MFRDVRRLGIYETPNRCAAHPQIRRSNLVPPNANRDAVLCAKTNSSSRRTPNLCTRYKPDSCATSHRIAAILELKFRVILQSPISNLQSPISMQPRAISPTRFQFHPRRSDSNPRTRAAIQSFPPASSRRMGRQSMVSTPNGAASNDADR